MPRPVNMRRLAKLVQFAKDVAETMSCTSDCEPDGGLMHWPDPPCSNVDCCCFRCDALRALRARRKW